MCLPSFSGSMLAYLLRLFWDIVWHLAVFKIPKTHGYDNQKGHMDKKAEQEDYRRTSLKKQIISKFYMN